MPDCAGPCLRVLHCDTEEPRSLLIPWEKLPKRQQCQNCPGCRKGRISFLKGNISKLPKDKNVKIACMKEQNNFSLTNNLLCKKTLE